MCRPTENNGNQIYTAQSDCILRNVQTKIVKWRLVESSEDEVTLTIAENVENKMFK